MDWTDGEGAAEGGVRRREKNVSARWLPLGRKLAMVRLGN